VTLPDSIEPDQLKIVAIVVLVVLALVALLVLRFIQKMVLRVVLAGVLVAAGIVVYAQRDDLDQCQREIRAKISASGTDVRCTCEFAGFDVTVPSCPALSPARDG
jgi:uncharacterized membrane protein